MMTSRRFTVFVCIALLVSPLGVATAIAAVDITGEFDGTMSGYDTDESDQRPNEITVEGEFTVESEDAQNVVIRLEPAQWTVIDTNSASLFVEGEQSVEFDQRVVPGAVEFTADQVPAGTTVQLTFSTYFTGGTDATTIEAGTVTVEYESLGGTASEESFTAEADASNSADNRINTLESDIAADEGAGLLMKALAAIGAVAIVVGLFYGGYTLYQRRSGPKYAR